jgi:hypothetical protein
MNTLSLLVARIPSLCDSWVDDDVKETVKGDLQGLAAGSRVSGFGVRNHPLDKRMGHWPGWK